MHPTHAILYDRLARFPIDDGEPALSFEARLAQEQRWPREIARRVTDEYRKFLLLAATAPDPVTPSRAVDEAWHLHLTYTRSYWDRLCGELLGRPLHHDPTRGGPEEPARFRAQYDRTLAAYRAAFGSEPPTDVWPRGDTSPKPAPRRRRNFWPIGVAAAALACIGCGAGSEYCLIGFFGFTLLVLGRYVVAALREATQGTGTRRSRRTGGESSGGWFGGAAGGCGSGGSDGDCGDAGGGGCGDGGGSGCGGGGGGGGCGGGGGGGGGGCGGGS
jgi:hypothetical protein